MTASVQRIEPRGSALWLNWREPWRHRGLLYFLVWRDVKVRYKQTTLGVLWAVLQPALTMAVFSLFFGRLAKMPSDGVPYPLFVLCGLIPWTLFSTGMSNAAQSLVASANLVTKVYFPRLVIPLASVAAAGVDFGVSLLLLVATMAIYSVRPGPALLFLPFFTLLCAATAVGAGLWLSALNVRYRDVRYTLSFLTQFWLFATPIAYPASLLKHPWRTVYALNPMVGVCDGFRWTLLGTRAPEISSLALSGLSALLLLGTGAAYFNRVERSFADTI